MPATQKKIINLGDRLTKNIRLTIEKTVSKKDLATTFLTGKVEVLSTPAIIILMEQSCVSLIEDKLPDGLESVSVEMNVKHMIPVKEGSKIICKVLLKYIDENRLFFDVAIVDDQHRSIAIGAHERYVVNHLDFMKTVI